MAKIRMKKYEFRVKTNVKPIPYADRKPLDLNIFEKYYFSYRENIVCACTIESLHEDSMGRPMAWVLVRHSPEATLHNLYADEIGRTPEEAIKHQWIFFA